MGAQGVVVRRDNRVLLVRHGYRTGWFFPGGGVERGESIIDALKRELLEEAGIHLTGRPELHGLFANNRNFPGDHIALFVVRDWKQGQVPDPNIEIAEQGFFSLGDLPHGTDAGTERRLREIFGYRKISENW